MRIDCSDRSCRNGSSISAIRVGRVCRSARSCFETNTSGTSPPGSSAAASPRRSHGEELMESFASLDRALDRQSYGGKAAHLARAIGGGFRVPRGFAISVEAAAHPQPHEVEARAADLHEPL